MKYQLKHIAPSQLLSIYLLLCFFVMAQVSYLYVMPPSQETIGTSTSSNQKDNTDKQHSHNDKATDKTAELKAVSFEAVSSSLQISFSMVFEVAFGLQFATFEYKISPPSIALALLSFFQTIFYCYIVINAP